MTTFLVAFAIQIAINVTFLAVLLVRYRNEGREHERRDKAMSKAFPPNPSP